MKKNLIYLILMIFPGLILAQEKTHEVVIRWSDFQESFFGDSPITILSFEQAEYCDEYGFLPVYSKLYKEATPGFTRSFEIQNPVYQSFDDQSRFSQLIDVEKIGNEIDFFTEILTIRGTDYTRFCLLPLRLNVLSGKYEKLISFEIKWQKVPGDNNGRLKNPYRFAENSVLAQGEWFKIGVTAEGIHKVTYEQMVELGMQVQGIDPATLRLFGNGGRVVPESNAEFRYDDLQENAIQMVDGADGSFDPGDYILFYGQSTTNWDYVPLKLAFQHTKHRYADKALYYLTIMQGAGKRIEPSVPVVLPVNVTVNTFNDYQVWEMDSLNLIHSGAEWYGEEFADVVSHDFTFSFPNLVKDENILLSIDMAAKSLEVSNFVIKANNDSITTVAVSAIPPNSGVVYANAANKTKRFLSSDDNIKLNINYQKPDESSKGWLNYIELNALRQMIFTGGQMMFRNSGVVGEGNVAKYQISNVNSQFRVWDITDILNPAETDLVVSGTDGEFRFLADSLRQFIGFDETQYFSPSLEGVVPNQNLHGHSSCDYIIISHPDFLDQAQRLKEMHEQLDGLATVLVTPQQIFNEFSSGMQDPAAIRDFVKMIYFRSGEPSRMKYLLLFGDGSYDPKNRIPDNQNFIMTFQSRQSLRLTQSYVTDDFYGFMDPNEGADAAGNVDVGIGRIHANTPEQAENMVDKIINYSKSNSEVFGNWRNTMCFIADDEDNNLHFYQADTVLVSGIKRMNKTVNFNKIYLDAYKQETGTSGYSYPEAKVAINKQVNEGALFVNYTGHGGETGWAAEKVLEVPDINSWTNFDRLPVFITATCEFSRFDNPELTSAGELILLNPVGGGVALFTTTRLAFSTSNLVLNKRIYDTLFSAPKYDYPRLGDLIMASKNPSSANYRNFVLLGDPALKPAFPFYNISTDSINGFPVESFSDTLKAGMRVSISGSVTGYSGSKSVLTGFNGIINPVLYDKPNIESTLGNDPKSSPYEFELQSKVLYNGKVSVKEGRFSFSFVIPHDISYQYGMGKLSYYAADSLSDASGEFTNFIIGGLDNQATSDKAGPEIMIFMNDTTFINGELVNPDPIFLANLSDPSGINTVNAGIGHEIMATLSGETTQYFFLNNYFVPDVDNSEKGSIHFPFHDLNNGHYTLELKAWDMFNNSSTKSIEFLVSDSIMVHLTEVYNFPNPFTDETWFSFRHNQFGTDLTCSIEIYDLHGQLVKTIGPQEAINNGYYIEPIRWNGESDGGSKLKPGFYVYVLKVENLLGYYSKQVQKLIITR